MSDILGRAQMNIGERMLLPSTGTRLPTHRDARDLPPATGTSLAVLPLRRRLLSRLRGIFK